MTRQELAELLKLAGGDLRRIRPADLEPSASSQWVRFFSRLVGLGVALVYAPTLLLFLFFVLCIIVANIAGSPP